MSELEEVRIDPFTVVLCPKKPDKPAPEQPAPEVVPVEQPQPKRRRKE